MFTNLINFGVPSIKILYVAFQLEAYRSEILGANIKLS